MSPKTMFKMIYEINEFLMNMLLLQVVWSNEWVAQTGGQM